MMKISDKGPWPFAELGTLAETRLGDWVLTLGHPGGYDPDRKRHVLSRTKAIAVANRILL